MDIGVKTVEGVVTLTGSVDADRQRRRAAIIASDVGGCREVNNLLRLRN